MAGTGELLSSQSEDELRWYQVVRMTEFLAPELEREVSSFACPTEAREHLMTYVKAKARAEINARKEAKAMRG